MKGLSLVGSLLVFFSLLTNSASALPLRPDSLLSLIEGYTGYGSSEAVLTFDHSVQIQVQNQPDEALVKERIEEQLKYLVGSMAGVTAIGAPKMDHVVSNVSVAPMGLGYWKASYSYRGTVVVSDSAGSTYDLFLPHNPATIYKLALDDDEVVCGNDEHPEPEFLFLYWNPKKEGCKLQEGAQYARVTGHLERLRSPGTSYPQYNRLVQADGSIVIHIFIGMNKPSNTRNPGFSFDVNAGNYRRIRKRLERLGFEKDTWDGERARFYLLSHGLSVPRKGVNLRGRTGFVEEFFKMTPQAKIKVRMFFGVTDDFSGRTFHYFLKDALENASVVFYAGHSGVGKYLDLENVERREGFKITLPADRYQIIFMNGCTSFSYYNTKYFSRKKTELDPEGTKNLEMLTNGLSTGFSSNDEAALYTVKAILDWAEKGVWTSYADLAKEIDTKNLFGVNGDFDNSLPAPAPR